MEKLKKKVKWKYLIILGIIILIGVSIMYKQQLQSLINLEQNKLNGFLLRADEKDLSKSYVSTGNSIYKNEIEWDIEKSGIESNLDITYKNINDTTTQFCIGYIDKAKYEKDIGAKINNIPITTSIKDNSLTLTNSIDLTKDNCFNISYKERIDGLSFQIGEHSVKVNSTFDTDATEGVGKNIYRDIYGGLNVAYTSAGNDIGFARSTDNGVTWVGNEIATGTLDDTGIVGNSTGGLLLYWTNLVNGNIEGITSIDNGATWSSTITLASSVNNLVEPSCDVDSNDIIHCCAVDSTDDTYYFNSSGWNTELELNQGGGVTNCVLAIDRTNLIYILNVDNSDDNVSLNYKEAGGSWSSQDIYKGSGTDFPNINALSISTAYMYDGDSWVDDLFISFGNKTFSIGCVWIGTWDCMNITGSEEAFLSAGERNNGDLLILSGSSATAGGSINISNSTQYAPSWSYSRLTIGDFPSIADQYYPSQAKMSKTAYYVFTNATAVYFDTYIFPYGAVINSMNPINGNFNTSSVTFNISTDINVSWCGVSINGGTNQAMTINSSKNGAGYINSSIGDGYNNYIVTCNDTGNNWSNSDVNYFLIDTVFPTINFTSPTPLNASTQSNTDIYVNVTANDSASNVSTFIDFDNSLVGWWRMDDTNQSVGTYGAKVYDISGYGNNGTAVGQATLTDAGKLGKGFSFDGSGDYINCGNAGNFSAQNFTVSFWGKKSDVNRLLGIGKGNPESTNGLGWQVLVEGGTGTAYFYFEYNNGTGTPYIRYYLPDGAKNTNWHYYALNAIFNGNNYNRTLLYIDGVSIALQNKVDSAGTISTTSPLNIGQYGVPGLYNSNGTIDEVMIFNRSLSAEEIRGLYANTSTKYLGVNFTGLSAGTHTFKAYAQDLGGNVNSTNKTYVTISSDTVYPQFSGYWDDNGTLVDTGVGKFNVTVENTNGTVILHINGTDILAGNLTANVYNATHTFTQAGTYLYNWTAYGNGTNNNLNTSINRNYVVNSSVSNCWTKTGTGRGSVLYIPRGCVYEVLRGDLGT